MAEILTDTEKANAIRGALSEFPDAEVVFSKGNAWELTCSKCKAPYSFPAGAMDYDVSILNGERCIRRRIGPVIETFSDGDCDFIKDYRSCDGRSDYILVKT